MNVPSEHDGQTPFTVELHFSEEPALGYETVRDSLIEVSCATESCATVTGASQVRKGSNREWKVTVEPAQGYAITLTLPVRACGKTGAVCVDGRPLAAPAAATIPGPVAISVADATVREAAGAALAFAVTLDRAGSEAVTVDYATSGGTGAGAATEGADYTATSGTLTFAAGATEQTVSVPVLADDHERGRGDHDVTLTNPAGARIADGTATGTIENTGPIPKAWIARFGRTVADQVLDAVGERMRGGSAASTRLTLGGHEVLVAGREDGDRPVAGDGGAGRARGAAVGGGL